VKFAKIKESHTTFESKLNADEELLQTLLTGLSSNTAKNKGGGYMGQLADAKSKIAQGSAEEEQAKVKLGMQQKELSALEARVKAHAKDAGDNVKRVDNLIRVVKEFERKVEGCGWSVEKERELEKALKGSREEVKLLVEVPSYQRYFDHKSNPFNVHFIGTRKGQIPRRQWQAQLRL
jgi:structural maintenance of chromosome 2